MANSLNFTFKNFTWTTRGVHRYTFYIDSTNLNFDGRYLKFDGHLKGKTNYDVTGLILANYRFNKIPELFSRNFPNLTALSISNCGLKSLAMEDLKGFKFLNELFVVNNSIDYLPGNLFQHNKGLVLISIANNGIKFFDPEIFDSLPRLEKIILTNSVVQKSEIPSFKQKIIQNWLSPCYEERKKMVNALKHQEMMKDLTKFIGDDATKDFTISVGSKEFKVHKLLLTFRSPTIAEVLANNPDADRLDLVDIPVDVFEIILSYLYTDQKPPNDSNFVDIFKAAGKLRLLSLLEYVADKLLKVVDEKNALEILNVSKNFDLSQLSEKAMRKLGMEFDPNMGIKQLTKLLDAKLKLDEASRKYEELRKLNGK